MSKSVGEDVNQYDDDCLGRNGKSICSMGSHLQIYRLLVSQRQARLRKHIPTIPTVRCKATIMNVRILSALQEKWRYDAAFSTPIRLSFPEVALRRGQLTLAHVHTQPQTCRQTRSDRSI